MIAFRDSELDVSEVRRILGDEAAGLTDDQVIALNEQMAAIAGVLCDAALDGGGPVAASSTRGESGS